MDRKLASNILALYVVKGLQYVISFVTFPFLTHVLQAQAFGAMNYAASVIQYGILFTDFGFDLSATREIAVSRDDPKKIAAIFWRTMVAKSALMLISISLLVVATALVPDWRVLAPVFLFSLTNVIASVAFPTWYFQGMEELRIASIISVLARALLLGFLLLLIKSPADVNLAVVLQGAPMILAGLFWWFSQWGLPRPAWVKPTKADIRVSLVNSWPFFLSALSTSLYTTATTTLVGLYAGVLQVGYFAAANKLLVNVQGLISLLVQATYPRIAQLAHNDKPAAVRMIRKAMLVQGGAGVVLTLILLVGAPWLMPFLAGHDLAAASPVMMWLAPIVLLSAFSYVFGMQSLLPFGQERYFSRVLIVAGIINVAGLLLFLPGHGAVRAAQVVLLVETWIVLAFWWRARRVLKEAAA
ncbi:oligosaccharide flippase family protein [Silvimonas iriomotensis]|uniref:Polysaccharide biosynthesis protein n=1 Tax=Silvimonas iriomotensis TaxID=449662 RepID=A0ABQ2PBQ2_9NEIS|nr:oligosaccharide flippase family protein [Silvimonas iriomotensis]GGP22803.1 polysaccharide biosynthesis protein [Silvimonas iriomotensis]